MDENKDNEIKEDPRDKKPGENVSNGAKDPDKEKDTKKKKDNVLYKRNRTKK